MLTENLKKLRGKSTQEEIAKKLGISRARYSHYENGIREPDNEMLQLIASFHNVSVDALLGRNINNDDNALPILTTKEEKDILKDLQKVIDGLDTGGYSQFDGQTIDDLDEDDRELLIASLENSMKLAKRLAKKKFTPKKYRD